ncbi:DUF4856 domain-containing protein [Pseudoalteromonas denitrificans]|uniref:DUF4856 domain-containing protein n=1 Tax=Pseudoalteromonas denitrificans DSM 6059 TaxID=1123010 RepID=A0A1I1FLS0_9GAMM|nr:DUF4856 domain-containing protein [Pseudoalteromonas denitrificans]SFC00255.1 protein of unknown function [Pseudoalteromonas denitrificans DSM 6059]
MFNMRKSILATAILAATFGLTACGGSSDKKETPVAEPVNTAPKDIKVTLTDGALFLGNVAGTTAGTISATDSDSGDTLTFTTTDENFEISGSSLILKSGASIDSETVDVTISVSDNVNAVVEETVTLTVSQLENYYGFNSKFEENKSAVSYSGQIARHALLNEVKKYIGTLTVAHVNDNNITAEQVESHLNALFADYDSIAENEFTFTDITNLKQKTFADIASTGKSLKGKIAGNDSSKQTKNWLVEGTFIGWTDFGSELKTPEGLLNHLFSVIVSQVQMTNDGEQVSDYYGNPISKLFITPEGLDLQQLVQKHLLGAIMFSQGTDDYLEDGLTSDNTKQDKDTKPYTSLEHQFDEGFGYFGATRDYLAYTDEEIAKKSGRPEYQGQHDTNGDLLIDLNSELIFGNSANAGKRDRGAVVATDFSADAMNAFIAGRKIISEAAPNALSDSETEELNKQRDIAVDAWEKAIAATVVHYINAVLIDLDNGAQENFTSLAKHWSELKGFALNFQFSPFSPMSESDFAKLHILVGDKPDLENIVQYKEKLIEASDIIQATYDFNAENVVNW